MKSVSFVLMIALAMATAPVAIAQQGQGSGSGSGQGSGQGSGNVVTATGQQQGRTVTTSDAQFSRLAGVENVRLELVVTDQSGTAQPVKKVMTLLLAERATGRVRSGGEVYRARTTDTSFGNVFVPVTLNADANITAIAGDRIRVGITVEYMPENQQSGERRTQLNQTVDVVLLNGRQTLIVESADPTSDRKVSLHATATIVR